MSEWTERETGICITSFVIALCIGMIIGVLAENPEIIKTNDEKHFNLTLYEKWDLNIENATYCTMLADYLPEPERIGELGSDYQLKLYLPSRTSMVLKTIPIKKVK